MSSSLGACGGGGEKANDEGNTGSADATNGANGGTTNGASGGAAGGGNAATGSGNDGSAGGTGDGGESDVPALSPNDTFYRADTLRLLAPRLVLKPVIGPQQNITADAQRAVNEGLVEDKEPDDGDGIEEDSDGDGYVDLNAMIRFLGQVEPSAAGGFVTAGAGLCPFPYTGEETCGPLKLGPFQQATDYSNGKDCALDGGDGVAPGSCFSSQQGAFTVNIQLIGAVPLENTQVVGSWVDDGAGGIEDGWIRGFLSEAVARSTKLPQQLPLAARVLLIAPGTPLIDFLSDDDKQLDPPGWWFKLEYTAKPAKFDASVGPDGEK